MICNSDSDDNTALSMQSVKKNLFLMRSQTLLNNNSHTLSRPYQPPDPPHTPHRKPSSSALQPPGSSLSHLSAPSSNVTTSTNRDKFDKSHSANNKQQTREQGNGRQNFNKTSNKDQMQVRLRNKRPAPTTPGDAVTKPTKSTDRKRTPARESSTSSINVTVPESEIYEQNCAEENDSESNSVPDSPCSSSVSDEILIDDEKSMFVTINNTNTENESMKDDLISPSNASETNSVLMDMTRNQHYGFRQRSIPQVDRDISENVKPLLRSQRLFQLPDQVLQEHNIRLESTKDLVIKVDRTKYNTQWNRYRFARSNGYMIGQVATALSDANELYVPPPPVSKEYVKWATEQVSNNNDNSPINGGPSISQTPYVDYWHEVLRPGTKKLKADIKYLTVLLKFVDEQVCSIAQKHLSQFSPYNKVRICSSNETNTTTTDQFQFIATEHVQEMVSNNTLPRRTKVFPPFTVERMKTRTMFGRIQGWPLHPNSILFNDDMFYELMKEISPNIKFIITKRSGYPTGTTNFIATSEHVNEVFNLFHRSDQFLHLYRPERLVLQKAMTSRFQICTHCNNVNHSKSQCPHAAKSKTSACEWCDSFSHSSFQCTKQGNFYCQCCCKVTQHPTRRCHKGKVQWTKLEEPTVKLPGQHMPTASVVNTESNMFPPLNSGYEQVNQIGNGTDAPAAKKYSDVARLSVKQRQQSMSTLEHSSTFNRNDNSQRKKMENQSIDIEEIINNAIDRKLERFMHQFETKLNQLPIAHQQVAEKSQQALNAYFAEQLQTIIVTLKQMQSASGMSQMSLSHSIPVMHTMPMVNYGQSFMSAPIMIPQTMDNLTSNNVTVPEDLTTNALSGQSYEHESQSQ